MNMPSVLTLVCGAAVGGIVAMGNGWRGEAGLEPMIAQHDPVFTDCDAVLESLEAMEVQPVEVGDAEPIRSPFLTSLGDAEQWHKFRASVLGQGRDSASPSHRTVTRSSGRTASRAAPRNTSRGSARMDPRTNRRRSIFELSRSYGDRGSALERLRDSRVRGRGFRWRSSRPYRSGIDSRLRRVR